LDEPFHVAVERIRDEAAIDQPDRLHVDTAGNWQLSISTRDLLRFVADNTSPRDTDTQAVPVPTPEHCRRVDEMMKLGDEDARAMIIADSLANPDAAPLA
jgi:hypothetical protein